MENFESEPTTVSRVICLVDLSAGAPAEEGADPVRPELIAGFKAGGDVCGDCVGRAAGTVRAWEDCSGGEEAAGAEAF